jgi:hypothetical protein
LKFGALLFTCPSWILSSLCISNVSNSH